MATSKDPATPKKPSKKPRGKPFKKGQSGNPKGRPKKGESMADIIRAILEREDQEVKQGNGHKKKIDRKTALAEKIVEMALKGYYPAMRDIVKLTDNTPLRVQHVDSDGNAIVPQEGLGILVVKKVGLDEWEKAQEKQLEHAAKQRKSVTHGLLSPGKRKLSRAQPSNSSSEEPREEESPTSSLETGSKALHYGAKHGEES